jgi:hypothetical protein
VSRISRTYLRIKAAISFFVDACDQTPLILPKMQDQILLTLCACSDNAHVQDVVSHMRISNLHIKAANTLNMNLEVLMSIFYH